MKYNIVNRLLAALLVSVMLCGTVAGASEPAGYAEDGTQAVKEDDGNQSEEDTRKEGEDQNEDAEFPVGDRPEESGGDDGIIDEKEQEDITDESREDNLSDEKEKTDEDKTVEEEKVSEEDKEEASEEPAQPDEETMRLLMEYEKLLQSSRLLASVGTYSSELSRFPASYQSYLKKLHAKHPKWIFVAVDTGLKWNSVVNAEAQYDRSLIPLSSGSLLLSKAQSDYNAAKGTYIPKDGSTWVTASKPAVAYYVDPRNFLTEEYIYMFEALNFNASYHKLAGVENVLAGTGMANKKVSYVNRTGGKVSLQKTYGELIFAAGKSNDVSPLFLASKIRQETGASLSNGSISGTFSYGGKSYQGYYNYYNIGAYATSTGSAVANGLYYAQGSGVGATSYGRPWTSPVRAIDGGAKFLAESYISKGQNTIYFEKFNTSTAPYYQHQYMQNLTAAASEAWTTYNSYKSMGILDDAYVFYIPVYKNMPSQSSTVSISKSVKKGKTTAAVNMRKGPSISYSTVMTLPENVSVTVNGGVYTDKEETVSTQQANPYWFKITYGDKTGYISAAYLKMNSNSTIKPGGKKKLNVTGAGSGETIYYETSNPAVATVSEDGSVTGIKKGTCMIYAFSSSSKTVDVIGFTVKNPASGTLSTPTLVSASNISTGIKVTWKKVSAADGYYVYRKVSGGKWSKLATVKGSATVTYTDKTAKSGKTYYYTASAYKGSTESSYHSTGVKAARVKYVKYKTLDRVNYRSGAGTSYTKKGTLAKGTAVQIVEGWSKKAGGYTWYKMYRNKAYYYIAAEYLKKS